MCGILSICKGVSLGTTALLFLGILVYNLMKSDKEIRESEHHGNRKTVWSKREQRFIEIPKDQDKWE